MENNIFERFVIHIKLLKSLPRITGLFIALFCIYAAFLGYLFSLGMSGFEVLSFLAKTNFMISLGLMVCSYPIFKLLYTHNQEEVVLSLCKNKNMYAFYIYGIIMIFLTIYNIIMGGIVYMNIPFMSFGDFLLEYAINVYLPEVIFLSLSFVFSLMKSMSVPIIVMIIIVFFASPWAESVVWQIKPDFPIDAIYSAIKRPFEIFYQNNEWAIDVQYGLQVELGRIAIEIGWLLLAIMIFMKSGLHLSFKKIKNTIVYIVLTLCMICSLFVVYYPGSQLRLDSKWNGYFQEFNTEQNEFTQNNTVDYYISEYDLEVETLLDLNVKGKLLLRSETKRQDFILTLYNRYLIKELTSSQSFTYEQKGNHIYLHFDKPTNGEELYIEYSGSHPRFYSNLRAISLPGYFPWYPMSGKQQYVVNTSNKLNYSIHGYNSYLRIKDAKITLKIDREIITNLPEVGTCVYSGVADSITLLDGYIEKTNDKQIKTFLPLRLLTKEEQLQKTQEDLSNNAKILYEQLGIKNDLSHKKIFIVSDDMTRNNGYGNIAIFDDYMLVNSYSGSPDYYLETYLAKSKKSTILRAGFDHLSFGETAKETCQNYVQNIESTGEHNGLVKLMKQAIQKIGEEEFLKQTYQYIFDDSIQSDEEYLKGVISND